MRTNQIEFPEFDDSKLSEKDLAVLRRIDSFSLKKVQLLATMLKLEIGAKQ